MRGQPVRTHGNRPKRYGQSAKGFFYRQRTPTGEARMPSTNRCAHCRQPLTEAAQGRCGDPDLPADKCWWIYSIPEMGMKGAIEMGQKIADRILPPGMAARLPKWWAQ